MRTRYGYAYDREPTYEELAAKCAKLEAENAKLTEKLARYQPVDEVSGD